MVFTRKFSQFPGPIAPTGADIAVGLHGGVNEQFQPIGGGGTGGGVTFTITQAMPVLNIAEWVTINTAGQYVPAEGDNTQDAEVAGVVVAVNGTSYTIQQSGYIQSSQNVFAGLVAGTGYFLSTTAAGQMVAADATINGTVSRPVFYADSATSGLVLPYRGLVVSGTSPSGGGGAVVDSNIVIVNQSTAGLGLGEWVYLNATLYAGAINTALPTSQVVGMIISLTPPNHFTVQFAGYFSNPLQFNIGGLSPTAGNVYYLKNVAGQMQLGEPVAPGSIVKPLFICDNSTQKSGYILPQIPLPITNTTGSIVQIVYNQYRGITTYALPATIVELNTNITLTNPANSVLITCSFSCWNSQTVPAIYVFTRNGVPIPGAFNTNSSGITGGTAFIPANGLFTTSTFTFLDTPGGVGPFTYSINVRGGSTTIWVNTNSGFVFFAISSMLLQEIT